LHKDVKQENGNLNLSEALQAILDVLKGPGVMEKVAKLCSINHSANSGSKSGGGGGGGRIPSHVLSMLKKFGIKAPGGSNGGNLNAGLKLPSISKAWPLTPTHFSRGYFR
jgi:hypothetical protein